MVANPYICSAPWVNLTIMENGDVKTCCTGKPFGNINKQSIYEIVDSDYLKKIKEDIENGRSSDNCTNCYKQEQQTGTSLRLNYNNCYTDITAGLQALDVRRSNLCNLTCIYCGPWASSSWADRLNNTKSLKNAYEGDLENWILENLETVQEITLVGGEPLLMKENYSLIDNINDNVRLSITTNLTIDIEKLPIRSKLLEKKDIIWNVSAENYGKRFEYVRNGASWNQFEKNLKLLVNNGSNISISFTYGIFSGLCLLDTVKHYHSLGINRFIIGSVFGHDALDIFNYPRSILELAYQEMQDTINWQKQTFKDDYANYQISAIDNYSKRMYTSISSNKKSTLIKDVFLKAISEYDKFTTDKFKDLWPENYNIIMKALDD